MASAACGFSLFFLQQILHIRTHAGHPQQAGLLIQQVIDHGRRHPLFLQQV